MAVRFSDAEKLGLLMLCDIYGKTVGRGAFDPDFVAEAVRSDYLWALSLAYPAIGLAVEAPEEVHEVSDILAMWSLLEKSYKALTSAQREQLLALTPGFHPPVRFPGFVQGREPQFEIATFFIKKMRKWPEFAAHDLRGAAPLLAAYRRMLPYFRRHRAAAQWSLNVTEIATLMNVLAG